MIHDLTNGRLDEIRAYATKHNLEDCLSKAFSRLERYSDGDWIYLTGESLWGDLYQKPHSLRSRGFFYFSGALRNRRFGFTFNYFLKVIAFDDSYFKTS